LFGETPKARRFRELAAEARAEAEKMTMPIAQKMLLEVAANYERLANTLDANANRAGREISS
jgi:DNA-binding ferritin-like protein